MTAAEWLKTPWGSTPEAKHLLDDLAACERERDKWHDEANEYKAGFWRETNRLALLSTADSEHRDVEPLIERLREDTCSEDDSGTPFYDASLADNIIREYFATRPAEQREPYPASRLQPVNYEEADIADLAACEAERDEEKHARVR